MHKRISLITVLLCSALVASARDAQQYESFLGFGLVRVNPNSGILPSFNSRGGEGQFVYNVNSYIGGVVDLGAVTTNEINHNKVDSTALNFMVGPRFKYHGESRFQPFVEMLFGGAYWTASTPYNLPSLGAVVVPPNIVVNPNLAVSARLAVSRAGFAMLAGGGVDIKINNHIALRPIGVDYYFTRLPGPMTSNPQNVGNVRYSAGINFVIGPQSRPP